MHIHIYTQTWNMCTSCWLICTCICTNNVLIHIHTVHMYAHTYKWQQLSYPSFAYLVSEKWWKWKSLPCWAAEPNTCHNHTLEPGLVSPSLTLTWTMCVFQNIKQFCLLLLLCPCTKLFLYALASSPVLLLSCFPFRAVTTTEKCLTLFN